MRKVGVLRQPQHIHIIRLVFAVQVFVEREVAVACEYLRVLEVALIPVVVLVEQCGGSLIVVLRQRCGNIVLILRLAVCHLPLHRRLLLRLARAQIAEISLILSAARQRFLRRHACVYPACRRLIEEVVPVALVLHGKVVCLLLILRGYFRLRLLICAHALVIGVFQLRLAL